MIPSRIERDIVIEAPAEVVWRVVTDPDQLQRWYCDAAQIDLRPGGEGILTFTNRATNKAATARVSVVSVEPPHKFSYRWAHPEGEEARPDNSTLVQFTLAAEGKRTRLRVVESGLDEVEWPDVQKATYADDHTKGWKTHMANLRDFVSREAKASAPR